jgi:hypothetical protein
MKKCTRAVHVFLVLLGTGCAVEQAHKSTASAPPPAPFSVGESRAIDASDVAGFVQLREVNVWKTPARLAERVEPPPFVICTIGHGDTATIQALQFNADEERWYARVKHRSCEGWLPESFLAGGRKLQ